MNWNMDGSICPACGGKGRHIQRYFGAICRPCEKLVTDADGRPVNVSNEDIWRGVRVKSGDTVLPKDTRLFINGIECQAREAHFGGIVIQPVAAWEERKRQIAQRREERARARNQD
jgi:ADP-ribosyl-[dinitrogen reductase] hydrolase